MAEKVTEMKVKVDLQCPCCYKKVKKILYKFPQIRDQVYDEKNNIVKIIVVCCHPEKIRDKLCCKGGKAIKSIEIVGPPPQKEKPPPQKEKPPPQRDQSTEPEQPKKPVHVQAFPIGDFRPQCYEGHPGGPCYEGYGYYGRPVPPPPCYDNYGYPYAYSCNRGCDQYFSHENPSACSIM